MKLSAGFFLLASLSFAQAPAPLVGTWAGTAAVHGQLVPLQFRVGADSFALVNGPESVAASSVVFTGGHVLATFADYNRTLDATLMDDKLTGSFGTPTTRYFLTAQPVAASPVAQTCQALDSLAGSWEIATRSSKGEAAWTMEIAPGAGGTKAFIQRVDGDTGSLYGACDTGSKTVKFSHLTAAGPALYSVTAQADGTILLSNMLTADKEQQQGLVGRRPSAARAAALPAPTDPSQQTRMKDPAELFAFSGVDLSGKTVTNADPMFRNKVVLVAVGGSWCPNCHDEAPVLEALYKKYSKDGFEIVDLSFEEVEQRSNPIRLKAFIASAGITYPVLLAGDPDELNTKLPQAENLNCWPTSFLLDRTGHVREIHAGFSGPATGQAYVDLARKMDAQVRELLAEPVPAARAGL